MRPGKRNNITLVGETMRTLTDLGKVGDVFL
jgi:hypothetical protein